MTKHECPRNDEAPMTNGLSARVFVIGSFGH